MFSLSQYSAANQERVGSNIPGDTASTYTTIFVQNHSTENVLPDLTKETLHDIIILNIIRGILNIIKHGNQWLFITYMPQGIPKLQLINKLLLELQLCNCHMFQLKWYYYNLENFEWNGMLLNILQVVHETKLMLSYIAVVMQTSEIVLLRLSDFFTLTKGDLLHAIERIINKQSNPSVYYLIFSSTLQLPKETKVSFIRHK